MFVSVIKMGVNIVCTLILTGKHDWVISLVAKCEIKYCYDSCTISVILPLSSRGA